MKVRLRFEEVYSIESVLNQETIRRYFSIGKERLILRLQRDSILMEYTLFNGIVVPEIINGCHRAKALFRHGISELEVECTGEYDGTASTVESWRLLDVPELDKEEYEKYLISLD